MLTLDDLVLKITGGEQRTQDQAAAYRGLVEGLTAEAPTWADLPDLGEPADPPNLAQVARALVAEGRSVIPVCWQDKTAAHPAPAWYQYRARRPTWAELEAWFGGGQYQALGVVCGAVSGGLVALDFDGTGADYAAFCEDWPELARSRTVITGSGKRHLWLEVDDRPVTWAYPTWAGVVEMFADWHYAIAPPSRHPSGNRYRWLDPAAPVVRVQDLAKVEQWFESISVDTRTLQGETAPAGGGGER